MVDYFQNLYAEDQQLVSQPYWNTLLPERQSEISTRCINNEFRAKAIYIFIYASLALLILIVVWCFNYLTFRHSHETYLYHRNLSMKYTAWLFLSLAIKMYLVSTLFSYETNTLPIYAISELIVMMLFSVFKKDEDCFHCFQRCSDLDTYSMFQMSKQLFQHLDEISEESSDNKDMDKL